MRFTLLDGIRDVVTDADAAVLTLPLSTPLVQCAIAETERQERNVPLTIGTHEPKYACPSPCEAEPRSAAGLLLHLCQCPQYATLIRDTAL